MTKPGFPLSSGDNAYVLVQDAGHIHPQWVHDQVGTTTEVELRSLLAALDPADWYDEHGDHIGDDERGLEVFRDESEIWTSGGRSQKHGRTATPVHVMVQVSRYRGGGCTDVLLGLVWHVRSRL